MGGERLSPRILLNSVLFHFVLDSPAKEKYVQEKKRHKIIDGRLSTKVLYAESVEHTVHFSTRQAALQQNLTSR